MADYTVEISLLDHKRGDKWSGIHSIGPVLINGAQPSATLARIKTWFVHSSGAIYKMDSLADQGQDATITISNATTWAASVAEQENFLQIAGTWEWDMEFYATGDDTPLTLYRGEITVHQDHTR
jgi:hypothetical protein